MKILHMTVGLPRSGKSTWARISDFPIVNPDSIRLALHGQPFVASAEGVVWATAALMVRSLFLSGHDGVILDATSITKARRAQWASKDWVVKFKLFPTAKETCIDRARRTDQEYLIPIIEKMAGDFEPPTQEEELELNDGALVTGSWEVARRAT